MTSQVKIFNHFGNGLSATNRMVARDAPGSYMTVAEAVAWIKRRDKLHKALADVHRAAGELPTTIPMESSVPYARGPASQLKSAVSRLFDALNE